jgi:hypothetical protein
VTAIEDRPKLVYLTRQTDEGPLEPAYAVLRDDAAAPVDLWPRTVEGVINATDRAARLSVTGGPHEVRRPDGRLLARYVGGRRADLPPGGIVHMAEARAAAGL